MSDPHVCVGELDKSRHRVGSNIHIFSSPCSVRVFTFDLCEINVFSYSHAFNFLFTNR